MIIPKEELYSVPASTLCLFMKELGQSEISIRVERPDPYITDPKKPSLVIPGIGRIGVHGGNHNYLVVTLTQGILEGADHGCVISSPDLNCEAIRKARQTA